jgi:hypothetical protein
MNLLSEDNRDDLVDSIANLQYTYNLTGFTPLVIRADEDIPSESQIISVSFMETPIKVGQSLNQFISLRENTNYSNYGYGEVEKVYVRVFSENVSGYNGRNIVQKWSKEIEDYIRVYWNSLITGGSIDQYTLSRKQVSNPFAQRQYGYEIAISVTTTNAWTDEPATDPTLPYDVSGILVETGMYVWVEI